IMEYITLIDNVTHIVDPNKQLFDTVQNSTQPVIVYMKIEEFRTIIEFYDKQTIELIQSKTKIHLEKSIKKYCNFAKVYQLGNGEYAMVNEKSLCLENKEKCISRLKEFQLSIKNNKIDIGDIDYDLSILISLAYEDDKILESAKLGINKQLETKQNFIVSNNLAKLGHAKAEKNMKIISMVKKAIETSSIVSYFQPIIDNKTQKIVKYESLVRLIDEEKKELSPFFFLDIAKRGKYYSEITTIVLNNSFNALKHIDVDISINLSVIDIEKESTRETIFELLEKNKKEASGVVFELLEDEDVKDFETIKKFIKDVKEYGVKIAIDDFGSGYSNFKRLIDYQPDILKIDGSLIKNIIHDSFSRNIVETIISFAKRENLQTIAEYVENEEIFNVINDLGVDYSQGYYFGKPEPLESN
ncbi:MAG: EAL domain-containing protein, partial [Campylobacterota bacterium]|nr:EAL domain-containing protein [Campylobacterota bacterium]